MDKKKLTYRDETYESFNDIYEKMLDDISTYRESVRDGSGSEKSSDESDDGLEEWISSREEDIRNLFEGVVEYGFDCPTPIQGKTIIPFFRGQDIIAQSQSGTGKTGAFVIGLLSRIETCNHFPQVILLATSRDLATQINSVCKKIAQFMGIKTCLTIGGDYMSVRQNVKEAKNSHIIIGTPGRVNNIISDKAFDINKVKTFVLDEADALLSEDFVDQIKSIIGKLPGDAQMCVFSATIDNEALEVTKNFVSKEPLIIKLKEETLNLEVIKQFRINLKSEDIKIPTLFDLYSKLTISQAVIFANTVRRAEYVYNQMCEKGYTVGLIHGDIGYEERLETLKRFRKGELRAIIATDVIARGIDVQQIGLVFNYDIPQNRKVYLHRIGRSGRFGKIGVAINFAVSQYDRRDRGRKTNKRITPDNDKLKDIMSHYKNDITVMPSPNTINDILLGKKKELKVFKK